MHLTNAQLSAPRATKTTGVLRSLGQINTGSKYSVSVEMSSAISTRYATLGYVNTIDMPRVCTHGLNMLLNARLNVFYSPISLDRCTSRVEQYELLLRHTLSRF